MMISRVRSTRHPEKVQSPFFAKRLGRSGDDEIQEAYSACSHLGCDEQAAGLRRQEVIRLFEDREHRLAEAAPIRKFLG